MYGGSRAGIKTSHMPAAQQRESTSRCKPSCCKTPHGHSTAKDHLHATHPQACRCHIERSAA